MKFNVKGRRLLVLEPDQELITKSGIVLLPGTAKELDDISNWYCEVLEVGDKVDSDFKVGDIAILDPTIEYAMFKYPGTSKSAMFVNQEQLLSTITK